MREMVKAKLAFLPGDGIGREVLSEVRAVLKSVARIADFRFEIVEADIGGVAIRKHGAPLPAKTREICLAADAVLLGAVGDPEFDRLPPSEKPERGLLELRKLLGNYANLRPIFVFDSLAGNSVVREEVVRGTDILFVRELLGGMYFGEPRLRTEDNAVNTESYTVEEIRRVAQVAFSQAERRRNKVTSVDKANVLETSALWREICTQVAAGFPSVAFESIYVDNFAMQLLLRPRDFDVVLTNNMFGDILSDEASVLSSSLGMLPSASVGGAVALYEPVHGSAPDIAGRGRANPIGAIASVGMLLEQSLHLTSAAALVQRAIAKTIAQGYRTPDIRNYDKDTGRSCRLVSTREMGEMICNFIESPDAA
jgi:3-isopropylmalate dehydrogenase